MVDDDDILMHFGGLEFFFSLINEDHDTNDEAPVLIRHSTYYDDAKLMNDLNNSPDKFNIIF